MASELLQNQVAAFRLDAKNPWPGLASYDEASQDFFHGRDAEASELLRLLRLAPLTALYGKSGLGKSSLLLAGLFPLLRANHFLPVWLRLDFSPGAKSAPLEQAIQHLMQEIERVKADCPTPNDGESLWEYLHRKDMEIWSSDNFLLTPVLVFDQFEELFSHNVGDQERIRHIFDNLADLIEDRIPHELAVSAAKEDKSRLNLLAQNYRIILSFREDYLPEIKSWEEKMPSLLRNYLRLEPLTRQHAIDAIEQAGKEVLDEGVAPLIVDFVGGLARKTNTIEPVLLSLFCYQLNLRRRVGIIDKTLVEDSGKDILRNFYRETLEDKEIKGPPDASRFIEEHLVQGERFRGSYPKEEALRDNLLTDRQLNILTSWHRLLRVIQHEDTARIELIHDCLVPVVCKARDEREVKEHQALLEKQLKEADARAREKESYNRSLIKWRKILSMAVILSLAVGIYATYITYREIESANREKESARRSMVTAATSSSYYNRDKDPELSTLLALQAVSGAKLLKDRITIAGAENSLRRAINSRLQLSFDSKKKVRAVSFRPQSEQLATGDEDGLHLWDTHGKPITPEPWKEAGIVNKIVFSKDGSLLVSGGNDGHIRLWDTSSGRDKTPKPMLHDAPISALALSPGNLLATGDEKNGLVSFWDIKTGNQISNSPSTKSNKSVIADLAFNAEGSRLAVGEVKLGKTEIWEIANLQNIRVAPEKFVLPKSSRITLWNWKQGYDGMPDPDARMHVNSIAFSPDGRLLATGDSYNTANLWDTKDGVHLASLFGHTDSVRKVAFSPDGSRLATASSDGTLRLWDMPTDRLVFSLNAHKQAIRDMAFSFDSTRLATASDDMTAKVWNVAAHADAVFAVAFSPDSKSFATGSGDTTIKLWEPGTRKLLKTLSGHKDRVQRLAFSPNGKFLASAGFDGTARIWELSTGKEMLPSLRYKNMEDESDDYDDYNRVNDVAFNADGKWLATAGPNHKSAVWNATTGKLLFSGQHEGEVNTVAFSTDGKQMASAGKDGLRLWEIATGKLVLHFILPEGQEITDVNFSPDGKRVVMAAGTPTLWLVDLANQPATPRPFGHDLSIAVTAQFTPDGKNIFITGQDPEVKFLNAITGEELKSIRAHSMKVNDAAVSQDAKWIATASQDGTFHVSPLNADDLLSSGCRLVSRHLDREECKRYIGAECPLSPCNSPSPLESRHWRDILLSYLQFWD